MAPESGTGTNTAGTASSPDARAGANAPAPAQAGGATAARRLPPYLAREAEQRTAKPVAPRQPQRKAKAAPQQRPVQRPPAGGPAQAVASARKGAATIAQAGRQLASVWRWTPVLTAIAVMAWIVALGLLFTESAPLAARVSSPRLTFAVTWGVAALLTFLPFEFRLGLPGLTIQGIVGWTLLGYLLAFAPPPTGWLLDLPDLPLYLVFFFALFYAVSAAALPLTFHAGRQLFSYRVQQLDMRRARRQAYEIGLLAVGFTMLGGLRVLSVMTAILLIAVFVMVEMLLLSQVAPES